MLSHVTPNMQCAITDSHAKSLEPQYSTSIGYPQALASLCPFSFSHFSRYLLPHTRLALITHLEKGTLDQVSFFDQSEAWHEPMLRKGKKALSFQINGLTRVLELLWRDAGKRALYHSSDCPWKTLFGTMGQKRKTPGTSTISITPKRHLYPVAPDL